MRERVRDKERLQHILQAIDDLQAGQAICTTIQAEQEPILFYGFVKLVEIIGEAVYMLSPEFKNSHPTVEWEAIEGMQHVLVHGYYHIKPQQLWDTLSVDIPQLRPLIEQFLQEENP